MHSIVGIAAEGCLRDVVLDLSRSGKPTDNAFTEAFNGGVWADIFWDFSYRAAKYSIRLD